MARQTSIHGGLTRRELLRASGLGLVGASMSGWLPALAHAAAGDANRRRHCILLWMNGGPSQLDTWDPKPDHENGGEFKPIATQTPGVQISEHLPKLAALSERLGIVRSVSTKEGDHGRATYLMRTGYRPGGPIEYPTIGALVSKELGASGTELPNFVSISPFQAFNPAAYSPGFLGPQYAAATVGGNGASIQAQMNNEPAPLRLDNLQLPASVDGQRADRRIELWNVLQEGFVSTRGGSSAVAHNLVYERAMRLMRSQAATAFDLEQEPANVRDAYGRKRFGQGCLLARRLVERGVPFVEVTLGGLEPGTVGWDTHQNNFTEVKNLSAQLDAAFSTLLTELDERGLLESTTILWMGEFGRTPKINPMGGRDHFPNAWSAVLAGGGIRGGQVHGRTSADGMTVAENPVTAGSLLATLCSAVGIDPGGSNLDVTGRPIKIADGDPISALLS